MLSHCHRHMDTMSYVGVGGDCVGLDLLDLPYQKLCLLSRAEVVFHKVANLERQLQTVYSHDISRNVTGLPHASFEVPF